ncbi:MAG: TIGR02221 family CRISPR-associated protein [Gammaproteobacteria bacterium]|nr:TIGR02221 family CRISPR-associated protein [Gammaproteobacteria bacterium]
MNASVNDTVLITLLGRSKEKAQSYRSAQYKFDDESLSEDVTFFGWALQRKIQPERLVLLGTEGSMWDSLFELDLDFGSELEEERLALQEACEQKKVTQQQLDALQQPLAQKLGVRELRLQLIPYCRTEKQQVRLLQIIDKQVQKGDELHLDVTHGFRHLPMLGLLAGLYLSRVRGVSVEKIYYAALDMKESVDAPAPVLNLAGLLKIADWVSALERYDHDGDYGQFAALLGEGNEQLKQAAFFERTTNPVKAREALSGWQSQKGRMEQCSAIAKLFLPELEKRVAWHKGKNRADWEQSLAYEYLEKEDFVRATMYGLEGAISLALSRVQGKDLNDYLSREEQRKTLMESLNGFKKLNRVRNALAHGVKSDDKDIRKMIADALTLKGTLKSLFKSVFA